MRTVPQVLRAVPRAEHGGFFCEMHTDEGDCPNLGYAAFAERVDLDRGYGFGEIGSALCAGCICTLHGDGLPPRAVEYAEGNVRLVREADGALYPAPDYPAP